MPIPTMHARCPAMLGLGLVVVGLGCHRAAAPPQPAASSAATLPGIAEPTPTDPRDPEQSPSPPDGAASSDDPALAAADDPSPPPPTGPFAGLLALPLTLRYDTNGTEIVCHLRSAELAGVDAFTVSCAPQGKAPRWTCSNGWGDVPRVKPAPSLWRQHGCYVVRGTRLLHYPTCPATADLAQRGGRRMLSARMLDDVTWTEPRYDSRADHETWVQTQVVGDRSLDVLCVRRSDAGMSKQFSATTCMSPLYGYVTTRSHVHIDEAEPEDTDCIDQSTLTAVEPG